MREAGVVTFLVELVFLLHFIFNEYHFSNRGYIFVLYSTFTLAFAHLFEPSLACNLINASYFDFDICSSLIYFFCFAFYFNCYFRLAYLLRM